MATFNQPYQRVGHQINGETVYVGGGDRQLVEKIDELISKANHANDADLMPPVLARLRQARSVAANGDERGAAALLRRAAELATPIAAIATSITAVVQGIQ